MGPRKSHAQALICGLHLIAVRYSQRPGQCDQSVSDDRHRREHGGRRAETPQESGRPSVGAGTPLFKTEHLVEEYDVKVYSSNYVLYGDISAD
jgi:hypothetical protein